jgi:DNA-binding response OmpR family regulator
VINCQRVVVVDEIADTGEVLKAVLEPRGWHVDRVRRLDQVREADGAGRPTLMVVAAGESDVGVDADCSLADVPRVIIGTLQVAAETPSASASRQYLAKPFHYAELLRAIDNLLTQPRAA